MKVPGAEAPYRRHGRESSAVGASIEAPTREGCGVGRGVPYPPGRGMGRGCATSPEKFSIFELKKRVLVHSGADNTYF